MSIAFNGSTQFASRVAVPSATDFCFAGWFRRDADSGGPEGWVSLDNDSYFQQYALEVGVFDALQARNFGGAPALSGINAAVSTWYYVMVRYVGGTLTVRHLADGDTSWQSNGSSAGLTDMTPDRIRLGAGAGGSGAAGFAAMTCALLRVYSGATLPTDTELLDGRTSTTPNVSTGLWANYPFASGDLGNDDGGSNRDLTLTASPTYSADTPDDLTVGGGGSVPARPYYFHG